MSYDFFAHHPIHNQNDAKKLSRDLDPYTRIMLFAQALISSDDKESVRANQYKNELRNLVKSSTSSLLADINLDTPQGIDLSLLPFGSFFISFKFQLTRPYISRDDEPFYIIDNPLVKEKVFKIPMVRPSSWKGALRAAIRLAKTWDANHPDLFALFGTVNDDQPNDGKRGRLCFYPTYFNNIDREVINPHDREKKAGKQPIYFECVPQGTPGTFTLLYVPLDRIGEAEAETRRQAAEDLCLVAEGLQAMFTVYGFGAKTSSGFGVATNGVDNAQIIVNMPDPRFQPDPPPVAPPERDIVREFRAKYPDETFQLGVKDWRKKHNASKREKGSYRKAKDAYQAFQSDHENYLEVLAAWQSKQQQPGPATTTEVFENFEILLDKAQVVASLLIGDEEVSGD